MRRLVTPRHDNRVAEDDMLRHREREAFWPRVGAQAPAAPVDWQRDAGELGQGLARSVQQARGVIQVRRAEDVDWHDGDAVLHGELDEAIARLKHHPLAAVDRLELLVQAARQHHERQAGSEHALRRRPAGVDAPGG
eukprot:scaffold36300_cov123-Isochrysis_galbana.AAC.5